MGSSAVKIAFLGRHKKHHRHFLGPCCVPGILLGPGNRNLNRPGFAADGEESNTYETNDVTVPGKAEQRESWVMGDKTVPNPLAEPRKASQKRRQRLKTSFTDYVAQGNAKYVN